MKPCLVPILSMQPWFMYPKREDVKRWMTKITSLKTRTPQDWIERQLPSKLAERRTNTCQTRRIRATKNFSCHVQPPMFIFIIHHSKYLFDWICRWFVYFGYWFQYWWHFNPIPQGSLNPSIISIFSNHIPVCQVFKRERKMVPSTKKSLLQVFSSEGYPESARSKIFAAWTPISRTRFVSRLLLPLHPPCFTIQQVSKQLLCFIIYEQCSSGIWLRYSKQRKIQRIPGKAVWCLWISVEPNGMNRMGHREKSWLESPIFWSLESFMTSVVTNTG